MESTLDTSITFLAYPYPNAYAYIVYLLRTLSFTGSMHVTVKQQREGTSHKVGVGKLRHAYQSVARGTIFNGMLSELKYNNYDLKKLIFNFNNVFYV
jgi:hypothetical protein